MTEWRGQVEDADLASVRHAGFSDAQIVEIVSVVAENILTNFICNAAKIDIDFPAVPPAEDAEGFLSG
jgi:alkylhydroperoxidase family enzyme